MFNYTIVERLQTMFADQIVHEMWDALKARDLTRALSCFSPDAVALGGILPDTLPILNAFQVIDNLWDALPDFHVTSDVFEVAGDTVSVTFCWGGTHTNKFNLGIPGMPAILPTGKTVLTVDRFEFAVEGDKIVLMEINSPPGGGMPGALRQIGSPMSIKS